MVVTIIVASIVFYAWGTLCYWLGREGILQNIFDPFAKYRLLLDETELDCLTDSSEPCEENATPTYPSGVTPIQRAREYRAKRIQGHDD